MEEESSQLSNWLPCREIPVCIGQELQGGACQQTEWVRQVLREAVRGAELLG